MSTQPKQKQITYKQIREAIKLDRAYTFNKVRYHLAEDKKSKSKKANEAPSSREDIQKFAEEKEVFCDLTGIYRMKEHFPELLLKIRNQEPLDFYDDIARIASFYEDENEVRKELAKNHKLLEDDILKVVRLVESGDFKGTMGLSLTAARLVLPAIRTGTTTFYQAKSDLGLLRDKATGNRIPRFELTRNPVVDHALAESRKVINAILAKYEAEYGMPYNIIIEFSRELAHSKKERESIERQNEINKRTRKAAREWFEGDVLKSTREASNSEVLRATLFLEQKSQCAYSLKRIDPALLKDGTNAVQIEHILPQSLVCDKGYMNTVLVLTDANQNKRNNIPYDFFKRTYSNFDEHWQKFVNFAEGLPHAKKKRLLMEKLDVEGWQRRSLNDTSHICRRFRNHLLEHLNLGDGNRIQTRKGAVTNYLRHEWGFDAKNREENDRHHIMDAIILACSEIKTVQKVFSWERARNESEAGKYPWPNFRHDADAVVNDAERLVSRKPRRTVTGEAHGATLHRLRENDTVALKRIKITDLTKKNIDKIYQSKSGERNEHLNNILRERLEKHGWDAAKAFSKDNPVYLIKKSDTEKSDSSAQIKHVRIMDAKTGRKLNPDENGGFVDNGSQARIDVFARADKQGRDKFYLCPIFSYQILSGKKKKSSISPHLPNKIISQSKEGWPEIDDSYRFLFSLYKNDYVRTVDGYGLVQEGYYSTTDIDTGRIELMEHDNKKKKTRISVQNLLTFEKYSVDYFGDKHRIEKEQRLGVAHGDDSEPGETEPLPRAVAAGK